jgi:hypothetical protein
MGLDITAMRGRIEQLQTMDLEVKSEKQKRELAVFDIETDPFLYGRTPEPFACCLLIEDLEPVIFWGKDCLFDFYVYLSSMEFPLRIYAHNGGKFDFVFLLRLGMLDRKRIDLINGRIVRAYIEGHELRDSYAILPIPLGTMDTSEGKKLDIDYNKMEEENREKNRDEIITYLKADCFVNLAAVRSFIDKFGTQLTIGGASIKQLIKHHPFDKQNKEYDDGIRKYYFGGRVQCFETGIINTPVKVYDVNSMYPDVMARRDHFCGTDGTEIIYGSDIPAFMSQTSTPYFLHFEGKNFGALPTRTKDGLDFNVKEGEFFATNHEVEVALKYGLIEIDRPIELLSCNSGINFGVFVDTFMRDKIEAKESGNKMNELLAKLIMNSSYGKTAQRPDNYKDWLLCDADIVDEYLEEWEISIDYGDFFIMEKPAESEAYFDVGIGASITGAARASLLEAIHNAERPLYCDTDSIICSELHNVDRHPTRLGAWDLEAEGKGVAIAGKKLYSVIDTKDGKTKSASKGVRLDHDELFKLASGDSVSYKQDAPSFKLNGETEFVQRILGGEKHSKLYNKFGVAIER